MKLLLFDVDGTLCTSSKNMDERFVPLFCELSKDYQIGIVGGGTMEKIKQQLFKIKDYVSFWFSENGLVYDLDNKEIIADTMMNKLGLNKIHEIKTYLNGLTSGNTMRNCVDIRNGLIYYALTGLSPSDEERTTFSKIDNDGSYRITVIKALEQEELFDGLQLTLGGQTGIAISPWSKTYMTTLLDLTAYESISFFGDKLFEYGNDHCMTTIDNVDCYPVMHLDDTYNILSMVFKINKLTTSL